MIEVAIIEDDRGIRHTVKEFINLQSDMRCEIAMDNIEEFIHRIKARQHLNVLLLDINLPNMSGLEAIPIIKKALPHLEIIMLTIHSSSEMVFKALCAGATGYLLKTTRLPEIANSIRTHHNGGSAMSPTIARMIVTRFNPKNLNVKDKKSKLTPREMQVLEALSQGLSYKLIADRLQMSPKTLPTHIRNIYKKLQINSKAEAIAIYLNRLQ